MTTLLAATSPSWVVRHRPKGDTTATAAAVSVPAVTPATAIECDRSTLPAGHIVTSIARFWLLVSSAPDYFWSLPEHPDPPEDRPLGIDAARAAVTVDGYPPVWVQVQFTRTSEQQMRVYATALGVTPDAVLV